MSYGKKNIYIYIYIYKGKGKKHKEKKTKNKKEAIVGLCETIWQATISHKNLGGYPIPQDEHRYEADFEFNSWILGFW